MNFNNAFSIFSGRGEIISVEQEGDSAIVMAKAPVKEMFGFAGEIRSATQGRALWSTEFSGFELLPRELLEPITSEIRIRKGLKEQAPTTEYYEA